MLNLLSTGIPPRGFNLATTATSEYTAIPWGRTACFTWVRGHRGTVAGAVHGLALDAEWNNL